MSAAGNPQAPPKAPVRERTNSRFDDLSLRQKALAMVGLLFGLFTAIALLFLHNQSQVRDALEWSQHTAAVLSAADDLLIRVPEQQAALRRHAQLDDTRSADNFTRSRDAFDADLRTLLELTADNAEQQARLRTIAAQAERWRYDYAVPVMNRNGGQRQIAADSLNGEDYVAQIDALKETINELINVERALLAARNAKITSSLETLRELALGSLGLGALFCTLALLMTQRSLTTPMLDLRRVVGRLTEGELDEAVPYADRADEIGAIAQAIERFRLASAEVRKREWIKRHLAELNVELSKQSDYQGFARAILSYLCPLLGAGYGLLYRAHEDGSLELIGGYGFKERRERQRETYDGLAAECARSKQAITLSPVPADYLKISSGLGGATPNTVRLLPLRGIDGHRGVAGVLELATFGTFSGEAEELLDEAALVAGFAVDALGSALRTRELLDETRTQAEELQASEEALRVQQEELRTTNEALAVKNSTLEEQGKRLRTSEEELRVQAEELRAANDTLAEKSRALNDFNAKLQAFQKELESKNHDLEQANRYKSEFLANMSHELRTPLNSLLILAKDLADNRSGNLDGEQVEAAQIIHDSGHNLLGLINDILDLSKIEAGRMDVHWEDVELQALAAQAERSFRRNAKERGLEFEVHVAAELPTHIRSDAAKVTQILTNLLGNAFKFTHSGQVRLSLSRPDAALPELSGVARDATIALSVSDSGIGIPADKLARLFQPFEQGDGTTSRRYGGTGLGLSISRALALMLGGDIVVRSTAGEGSHFTLLLPERETQGTGTSVTTFAAPARNAPTLPQAPADIAPAPTPSASMATPQVVPVRRTSALRDDRDELSDGDIIMLIVEDDGAFARVLADITRRKGYRVLLAGDGDSALELARRYRPSGILLDVDLPGLNGWGVMEKLKADTSTRHIPVHFITATDDASRGLAMGAVGFLTKPATREALDAAFQRVLHFADGRRRHVLVVDDEAGARLAIRKLLAEQPIDIDEADTAATGLERISAQNYDCVILDLSLPDASGFEFLERLAGHGQVPPIVIYSARELTRDENMRLREYTDSIVIKGAQSPGRLLDEVSLFLHAMRRPASPTATAATPSDLAGRTVLVVDDDMRNVFALSKTLRAQGLHVLVAQDGQRALAQLEQHERIDWVLMDVMMPGMDGYTATREIRKRPQWRELPVIAVTAKAMPGDREKCIEAGASDYLTKPVDVERLLSMLRAWLRHT